MRFYTALIRLSGSLLNEVRRNHVSAPEVMLLNAIHGGNAVVELVEVENREGFTPEQHRKLRATLRQMYGEKPRHVEIMNSLFGPVASALLPTSVTLADLTPQVDEPMDTEIGDFARAPEAPNYGDEDPKAVLKATLRALDWPVPTGNVSEARLREEVKLAQEAANKKLNVLAEE